MHEGAVIKPNTYEDSEWIVHSPGPPFQGQPAEFPPYHMMWRLQDS